MIIIGIYSKLFVIIAIICAKFYNVYNSISLDYSFAFLLSQIIQIIAFIVNKHIIVFIVIIGTYVIDCT
jgi:hypothetical protein